MDDLRAFGFRHCSRWKELQWGSFLDSREINYFCLSVDKVLRFCTSGRVVEFKERKAGTLFMKRRLMEIL